MSEDWLDTGSGRQERAVAPLELTELPASYAERTALVEACWQRLTVPQRTFLTALRDNRFNARAASRALVGHDNRRTSHQNWMQLADYATVVRVWRANAAANALDRDRLLARHDDIVETALTPKPVLHEGIMVRDTRSGAPEGAVLEEVDVGAAARANETLMKAAGMLKEKDVEVNVGVLVNAGPPTLNIAVMPRPPSKLTDKSVTVDAKFTQVPTGDEDWLS